MDTVGEDQDETAGCAFFGVVDDDDDNDVAGRGDEIRGGEDRGDVYNGDPSRSIGGERAGGAAAPLSIDFETRSSRLPDLLLGGVGVWVGETTAIDVGEA